MNANGNGARVRLFIWAAGVIATAALAVLLAWTASAWGQVEENREAIAEGRTEQAILRTKIDYIEGAVARIERKLGTGP